MVISVSEILKEKKEKHPDFKPDEEFLFELGKDLEIFFLSHDDAEKAKRIDDKFALLISKVFTDLSVSTIPFESERKLYFHMMEAYYQFASEEKLSSLMDAYSSYLTFRYDVFHIN